MGVVVLICVKKEFVVEKFLIGLRNLRCVYIFEGCFCLFLVLYSNFIGIRFFNICKFILSFNFKIGLFWFLSFILLELRSVGNDCFMNRDFFNYRLFCDDYLNF